MAKTLTGKKVTFELEFYWRGKRRKPSVNMIFERDDYDGLPNKISDSEVFATFNKAAHALCKVMVDAGELDSPENGQKIKRGSRVLLCRLRV